jgi:hypothetical protein
MGKEEEEGADAEGADGNATVCACWSPPFT